MRLRYLSHPQVLIDPGIPVADWSLSQSGSARIAALAGRGWPGAGVLVLSSPERKACETAQILALPFAILDDSGEVDRSATGYVPHDRHEELADQLFAQPDMSACGWERAVDAQARIVACLDHVLRRHTVAEILLVGHGAVGSFLWCHLTARPIRRSEDQPAGGGCVWEVAFDPDGPRPVHSWRPVERIAVGDVSA